MELLAGVFSSGRHSNWKSISEMQLPLTWVGFGMLAATIVTWLIFRWRRARSTRRMNSPRLLLRDLYRLHHLSWNERYLILRIAKRNKIANPARLFLEPELWQQAIKAERAPVRQRQLKSLHAKLLGG